MKEQTLPQIAELLQSIHSASWTATTALGLGRTVQLGLADESYIEPSEIASLGLTTGYGACCEINEATDKLADLLGIELKRTSDFELRPVYKPEPEIEEAQS